jgi:hypothetical protein
MINPLLVPLIEIVGKAEDTDTVYRAKTRQRHGDLVFHRIPASMTWLRVVLFRLSRTYSGLTSAISDQASPARS